MVKTNGEVRLVGFVDMGPEAYHLNIRVQVNGNVS